MRNIIGLFAALVVITPAGAVTDMRASCVVANEICFTLKASAWGLRPFARMDVINERLAYILGFENPHKVRVVLDGNEVAIYVGRNLLVTVTEGDRVANGAPSRESLALIWAANLRHALPRAIPLSRLHR